MIIPSRQLGNTRSGKNICFYETKEIEYIRGQTNIFDEHDHFDSFCLFQFLIIRAVRQYGEFSEEAEKMEFMSEFHRKSMNAEFVSKEKNSLAIVTSIDICNYGKSRVKHIFRK